jgi:hypothetical protein
MTQIKLGDENHKRPTNILVVGDWVIDEHWLVGIHRSRTSTRVGRVHYRTIQTLQSTVTALCGAGRTAGLLYRARKYDQPLFNVTGVGLWHVKDTGYLRGMLDPNAIKWRTPHQINLTYESNETKPTMVNLVEESAAQSPGTIKVIRLYQQTGSTIKLVERIDWELQAPEFGWYSRDALNGNPALNKAVDNAPIAIVVQDFLKGTLSRDLVEFLVKKLPNADWFISSKQFEPQWQSKIPVEHIRLIEIPEAAMQDAIESKRIADTWLTRQGMPTKAALSLLNELGEKYVNATFIAIPNEHTILSHRGGATSNKEGAVWVNREKDASPVGLPMSSVCFGAFIAHMLSESPQELTLLVDYSTAFTQAWRQFTRGRLEAPTVWDPGREPRLEFPALRGGQIRSEALRWTDDLDDWKASYEDKTLGVITNDGKRYIELWRAMTLVKNYICIAASKRRVLQQILYQLDAFQREQRGARSCMIIATPGSGKSLLAQLLAEDHGLQYLEFNITQMLEKSDLMDCFDVILTTQFENPGKQLLVFVDEIDAHLAGEPVYDMFLSVLERGVYRRAGKTFPLQPCFWLFAGTVDPRENAQDRKGNDFVSRLTLRPLTMGVGEGDKWQLENVYLGAALLRVEFPDVREVSSEVLELFHSLPSRVSIRELRQFVRDFVDIRSGEVRWRNVPQGWLDRLQIREKVREHESPSKDIMVEIRGEASRPTVVARLAPESLAKVA